MKQVAVHGLNSDYAFAKDIDFFYMGGYVVDWSAEGCGPAKWWNQSHNWWKCDDKFFNNQRYVVNREYVYKFEDFKYCAIENYHNPEILKYLRTYLQYPQTEYLVKMNLGSYATKVTLLKKLDKNKDFRRWFSKNSKSINEDT